ncbi:hypothetical protein OSH11_22720 [Kaistia dalseonensis]|uniref:Uncharacterized protein n=1 Tax=Kaistia dalseonensis TaxID=410840 RepID=A0ABU0HCX0_9HYPH|nr:hypothetical protein [Kaistia dalseonensis]MCX5497529.1 hypothetical protein [Kaistia dalseonensis]MDQ0440168.1 hypothetical protein [Kaistia dalseonensis]
MSEAEIRDLIAALRRAADEAKTPEAARAVLRREGVIDEHGDFTEPFRVPADLAIA